MGGRPLILGDQPRRSQQSDVAALRVATSFSSRSRNPAAPPRASPPRVEVLRRSMSQRSMSCVGGLRWAGSSRIRTRLRTRAARATRSCDDRQAATPCCCCTRWLLQVFRLLVGHGKCVPHPEINVERDMTFPCIRTISDSPGTISRVGWSYRTTDANLRRSPESRGSRDSSIRAGVAR